MQKLAFFCIFPVHGKIGLKWPQLGPGVVFSLLIHALLTFWAELILILTIFMFLIFWDSKFPDLKVQISRSSEIWLGRGLGRPGLGPDWTQLGPPGGPLGWAPWRRPLVGPRVYIFKLIESCTKCIQVVAVWGSESDAPCLMIPRLSAWPQLVVVGVPIKPP